MADLRQLRTFIAVAEELNFTRAAQRLFVAQQAVSKTVRQLEGELGVELLERTTHDVRLTKAGAALLEDGRRAVAAAEHAFGRARREGQDLTGTVHAGVSPAIGPLEREESVRVLREGAPALSVSLIEVRPRDVARLLQTGELDLALVRSVVAEPGVESAALRPTPVGLSVPAEHRLAGLPAASLTDLDGERLLVWNPPGTPFTDLLVDRITAAGAHVELVEARVTGGLALPDLTEIRAVALLPAGWPSNDGVVMVSVADAVTLPLLVLWVTKPEPPAVQRLRAGMSTPPG